MFKNEIVANYFQVYDETTTSLPIGTYCKISVNFPSRMPFILNVILDRTYILEVISLINLPSEVLALTLEYAEVSEHNGRLTKMRVVLYNSKIVPRFQIQLEVRMRFAKLFCRVLIDSCDEL